jgi:hypothetical protein
VNESLLMTGLFQAANDRCGGGNCHTHAADESGSTPPICGRNMGLAPCLGADLRLWPFASQNLPFSKRPNCGHEMCRSAIVKLPGSFSRPAAERRNSQSDLLRSLLIELKSTCENRIFFSH